MERGSSEKYFRRPVFHLFLFVALKKHSYFYEHELKQRTPNCCFNSLPHDFNKLI